MATERQQRMTRLDEIETNLGAALLATAELTIAQDEMVGELMRAHETMPWLVARLRQCAEALTAELPYRMPHAVDCKGLRSVVAASTPQFYVGQVVADEMTCSCHVAKTRAALAALDGRDGC